VSKIQDGSQLTGSTNISKLWYVSSNFLRRPYGIHHDKLAESVPRDETGSIHIYVYCFGRHFRLSAIILESPRSGFVRHLDFHNERVVGRHFLAWSIYFAMFEKNNATFYGNPEVLISWSYDTYHQISNGEPTAFTMANSQKVYLGDSSNGRQSEMAAETVCHILRQPAVCCMWWPVTISSKMYNTVVYTPHSHFLQRSKISPCEVYTSVLHSHTMSVVAKPDVSIWPPKPEIITSLELWQIASKFQRQIRDFR